MAHSNRTSRLTDPPTPIGQSPSSDTVQARPPAASSTSTESTELPATPPTRNTDPNQSPSPRGRGAWGEGSPLPNTFEFKKACEAISAGHSILVLGETGCGITDFAKALHTEFELGLACAMVTYKGSTKHFLQELTQQLGLPIESETGRPLPGDVLKAQLAQAWHPDTLYILPEAKRLPASVRYWLQDAIAAGVRIAAFAPANPGRDLFLDLLEIELELPSDAYIRVAMVAEAQRLQFPLSRSRLAELQPLAGRNPKLARKVIQREALGLQQDNPEHTQYIVIMPIIIAMLLAFGIVRFVGFGTGNRALYVTGGVCLVAGMILKQLGQVRGARKRLGQ